MDDIKTAFEKMVQVPDAWNNPMMQPVKNGFILGWESGAAHEREACAKVCDKYAEESGNPMNFAENCAAAIRARSYANKVDNNHLNELSKLSQELGDY